MIRYLVALLLSVFASHSVALIGATSVEELLEMVEQGRIEESREHKAREARFLANKNQQQAILSDTIAERKAAQQRSETLEAVYTRNEKKINELKSRLDERMGSLKEMFGHLQTSAGTFSGILERSITSAQYPGRSEFFDGIVDKVSQSDSLPSINEMEKLWFEIQREIAATGEVARFQTNVISESGQPQQQEVIRLGSFNLLSDGVYLQFVSETGKLLPYAKQPPGHYQTSGENFQEETDGLHGVGLDPTRGAILSALVDTPSILERIEQGGLIGYFILALGALALLLSIERMTLLLITARKINKQMQSRKVSLKNPLGRIFKVYMDNRHLNVEALELKLGEAILKERLPLERFISTIKIVAVVAPLLGLLGTVTGMIKTFQAITLFGTGDPKLMAGGISQALVTTVEGLAVAVPIVLIHALVNSRYRHIIMVLEEQSTGLVAAIAEKEKDHVVSG
ncbi:MAG: MotA/TolQ/ExbB proton channel family protein [Ketobacteraceae bacterium]|nr:MotA/TolQ/ExbB proton channel family protein [Ketobacteraceae bacterium]